MFSDRHPDPEDGAFLRSGTQSYLALAALYCCLTDAESQAWCLVLNEGALVAEKRKDVLAKTFRDALARVFHLDVDVLLVYLMAHADIAFAGMLDSIVEQMAHDELQLRLIKIDDAGGTLYNQFNTFGHLVLEILSAMLHSLAHIAELKFQFLIAGLDMGKQQQLIDEVKQLLAIAVDEATHVVVVFLGNAILAIFYHHFAEANDCIERCAKGMAYIA